MTDIMRFAEVVDAAARTATATPSRVPEDGRRGARRDRAAARRLRRAEDD